MIGDAWFSTPPSDWIVERLKFAVTLVDEKVDAASTGLPYIGLENVESWTGRQVLSMEFVQSEGIANRYAPGDILFAKLRPYLAKALRPDEAGIASTEFLVLRPRKILAQYLLYVLLSGAFIDAVNAWTYGVKMPRASWDVVGNLLIPFPPLEQQRALVNFLDRKTVKADALAAKYERLIELLEEKRIAMITQAVTKGLIREIPADWKIVPFRHILVGKFQYGASESGDPGLENAPRYIRITDIGVHGILLDDDRKFLLPEIACPYMLEDGDLLFARSGATVGKSFLYSRDMGPACFAGYLIRARINTSIIIPAYLQYFASSTVYWSYIRSSQYQATIENVSASLYSGLPVPVPSIEDQSAIVVHLDVESRKINVLCDAVRKAIAYLREHRNALITAAVTGAIDVHAYGESKNIGEKIFADKLYETRETAAKIFDVSQN